MNKSLAIPTLLALVMIALFTWVGMRLTSVFVFIPMTVLAYLLCLIHFSKNTPNPDSILSWYLLALGIQFLHFTEEYLNGFITKLPALFGQAAYPLDTFIIFNMVAYFVFILGAIVLFKRIKEFLIIPVFFILVGVIFNSMVHILLALYVGGYFPGLFTAIIFAVLIPVFMKKILLAR